VLGLPVRLGNDAHAKALGLQQATDDGHAERRMVDVSVAGHDDDVAGIPAELIHLLPAHRQERCWPEAFGPVLGIVEEWFGCLHVSDRFCCAGKSRARNIAQILIKSDGASRIHQTNPTDDADHGGSSLYKATPTGAVTPAGYAVTRRRRS